MSSKPKLAFLSSLDNSEQRGGAYLRVTAIVEIFKELGFDITMFYMDQWNPKRGIKGELLRLYYQKDIRVLFSRERINLTDYDYVLYDNLRFFQWDISVKESCKLIYNAHNLEFESYYLRCEQSSRSCRLFKQFEVRTIKRADLICVCSQREKETLIHLGISSRKVFVIPNLIDRKNYYSTDKKDTILFIGSLDYYPNILAIDFLCDAFIKNIPQEISNQYEFVIAGRNPSAALKRKVLNAGFTLRENLEQDEVYELLSRTIVSLVPLEHGSGTRLKIVESLFSNSFVLSTPLGAEGFEQEQMIEIANLDEFASRLVAILKNQKDNHPSQCFYQENSLDMWIEKNIKELRSVI
jgi:glycosyltransferase involved in cell wall biosynthesis